MSEVLSAGKAFLPSALDLSDPGTVETLYRSLFERSISDRSALEQWLLDRSELEAIVSELGA